MKPTGLARIALTATVALGAIWSAGGDGGPSTSFASLEAASHPEAARQVATPTVPGLPESAPLRVVDTFDAVDKGGRVAPGPQAIPPNRGDELVVPVEPDDNTGFTDRIKHDPSDRIEDLVTTTGLSVIPEALRPGTHPFPDEPPFTPVGPMANPHVWGMRWVSEELEDRRGYNDPCRESNSTDPVRPNSVGFRNVNKVDDLCSLNPFYQLAFKFDFSTLRQASFLPISAALKFHETVYEERDSNGNYVPFVGFQNTCSLRLGRPNGPWNAPHVGYRGLPYTDPREQNRIGEFNDILDWVVTMVRNPAEEAKGLILIGKSEDRNPDNAACMSQISNIELVFTYVIADR